MQQALDFLEEVVALAGLLENQAEKTFDTVTLFKSWTINDVIGHLYIFDVAALKTLESKQAFETFFAPIKAGLSEGKSLLETQFSFLEDLRGRTLFDAWLANTKVLAQTYALADPKQRVSWAGPEMSVLSSITARQMETWAHGHEVFDALGVQRIEGDRIKNICHLGAATFGWTFLNRKMDVPEPTPYVELIAPSGQIWTWNDPTSHASIYGRALEFAQVVTQVRGVDDTQLEAIGPSAKAWMSMAQCFAGKPETPPQKGSRYKV